MVAEDVLDGLHLADVANGGARAVNVDVVNLLGLHLGILQCVAHNQLGTEAFGVAGRDVVGVGAHATTGNFGVDVCATCLGVLQLLKDEHGRTFGHHKTIAAGAEGAACLLGLVVAG